MAIYTIIDNRDIDNKEQNWLSSVVSLSAFYETVSGMISGDYLDDTILKRMEWMDLSSLTKISADLSNVFQEIHLSNMTSISSDVMDVLSSIHLGEMVTVSGDVDDKLGLTKLRQMPVLSADINTFVGRYLSEHGYQPGGGGGGASITYKYWRGVYIPPHPGGGPVIYRDISECTMTLVPTSVTYDGTPKTVNVTVTHPTYGILTNGQDYSVQFLNNVNVGTATVIVNGQNDYTGSITSSFQILPRKDISDCTITLEPTSVTYDGTPKTVNVTVTNPYYGTLTSGTDYSVQFTNNVYVGTATVTVNGQNSYIGSKTSNFQILLPGDWDSSTVMKLDITSDHSSFGIYGTNISDGFSTTYVDWNGKTIS